MSISEVIREQPCVARQNTSVSEHRDLQATAMSVDWSSRWVLLAGRRHLALQQIDTSEDNHLRKYHRNSKYDVSAAEWAICKNFAEYCAIATSQLIEVVTWTSGDPMLIYSLRAHTRMVTDIDWHSKEPHLLASCSIDTFTHLWDLRDPKKPTLSLSAVCMSGATQVGFNRVSGNLLATAHDGDLRIWDIRKGSCPIQYITAHNARIHGINWSHIHETYLTTASQDGTVKYFDVNNPRRAQKIITTSSPVWRARYTPIGNGLVSIVVPHLGRGENSLLLWSNSKQTDPICSFVGHTDVILDFAWRPSRDDNNSEIEFFTWSRDQTLRQWKIDENLIKHCESSNTDNEEEVVGSPIDSYLGPRQRMSESFGKSLHDQTTCSLQHEFSLLNTNIPHVDIEILDPVKRNAIVRITVNVHTIVLQIKFPQDYPSPNIGPEFNYCPGTSVDENLSTSLMKVLRNCALQRVKKSRSCLEQCLRAIVVALKKSSGVSDKSQMRLQSPRLEGALSSALHDACIPFPKTSGAKFSNAGVLVTFCQPLNTKRISLRNQNTTPRALSAINGGYLGNVMGSQPVLYAHRDASTSTYYIQDRIRKNSRNRSFQKPALNTVINVYDINKLLNLSKDLAENYILDKDNIEETCRYNKQIAEKFGRNEQVQVWSLAQMIASPVASTEKDDEMSFQVNPFKNMLLESLILHFAKNNDIQMAVMLCCTFEKYYTSKLNKMILPNPPSFSAILPKEMSESVYHPTPNVKKMRSNSLSASFYDMTELRPSLKESRRHLFDIFKRFYAEILYNWRLLPSRAVVLKHLTYPSDETKSSKFVTECLHCRRVIHEPSCKFCRKMLLYCTFCRLPVRGVASACILCGHGGHTIHLKEWFKEHEVCAAGCGCYCLRECGLLLNDFNLKV